MSQTTYIKIPLSLFLLAGIKKMHKYFQGLNGHNISKEQQIGIEAGAY